MVRELLDFVRAKMVREQSFSYIVRLKYSEMVRELFEKTAHGPKMVRELFSPRCDVNPLRTPTRPSLRTLVCLKLKIYQF